MAVYESTVTIRNGRLALFEFFRRPENLLQITLPELKLRFREAPTVLETGSVIEFEVTHFGQGQVLRHEILHIDESRLVERQIKGPLKSWHHTREFHESASQEATLADRVEFEPPGGMLGFVLTEDRISNSLSKAFAYQHSQLASLLDQGDQ